MNKNIRRVTGNSKLGRQMRSQAKHVERGPGLTREQIEWNARVERERQEKAKRG